MKPRIKKLPERITVFLVMHGKEEKISNKGSLCSESLV
jgi:hypothetical protein